MCLRLIDWLNILRGARCPTEDDMRFATAIIGGPGQTFGRPYFMPHTGSQFLAHVLADYPSIFDRQNWLWLDYLAADAAYRYHATARRFDSSSAVVLAFMGPDGGAVILRSSRDKPDEHRDALADTMTALCRRQADTLRPAVEKAVKILTPEPRHERRTSLLAGLTTADIEGLIGDDPN